MKFLKCILGLLLVLAAATPLISKLLMEMAGKTVRRIWGIIMVSQRTFCIGYFDTSIPSALISWAFNANYP